MLSRFRSLLVLALAVWFVPAATQADELPFDFLAATHLVGVSQGSSLSGLAKALGNGSFETSGGSKVTFDKWYSANWVDTRADFITQVSPRLGVLWGLSTGEQGAKYTIYPSLKLGLLAVFPLSKASKLSFSATALIGGQFRERACTADYGDISGVQQVNCRLAATEMAPAKTLAYLVGQDPSSKTQVSLQYTLNF